MDGRVRWRLAAMMALVYAVQGAWWPLLAMHLADLGVAGPARGWIFATLALASMAMPLGAGRLVDRVWSTQKLLSGLFVLGAGWLVAMACGAVSGAPGLFALFLTYWLVVAPGFGLCNALAMRNLPSPASQFAGVRLWGTVGWMLAGFLVTALMTATGSSRPGGGAFEAFWIAAALALALAALATRLPDTPPLDTGGPGVGTALEQAWELCRRRDIGPYLAIAFGVNLTIPFVYQVMPTHLVALGLPRRWIATAMTLGQLPEIAGLAALPWILRRWGERRTLAVGIAAWAVEFFNLAAGAPLGLAIAGIPLHGVGIACFSISGQLYLDARAPAQRRAGAQALNMVVTSGLGSLGGSLLAGASSAMSEGGDGSRVFLVPGLIDAVLLVYVTLVFRPDSATSARESMPARAHISGHDGTGGVLVRAGHLATETADG